MNIRLLKVIRDITSDYAKNLMLVLAIAIGVFGIGSILGAYSVLTREMSSNYLGTNPASATLETESEISRGLLDSVRQFPGIQEAERHATVSARMKVGDKWYPMLLFVIDDFASKKTNQVSHLTGSTTPATGEMLVERTALVVMQANEGDEIGVKTSNGEPAPLKISGTVHDAGLAPAWQEQAGYGYITLSTLHYLGESQGFDQLRIVVSENALSREAITAKAGELSDWLEARGIKVHEIQVPPPGKHPHQSQMRAVLTIFTTFSFLILVLGSILVATSVATLMVKQVRQIGVMKTIGATSLQITMMYVLMIVMICVVALALAIPLSRVAAAAFYQQIAVLLNLELADRSVPLWVPLLQIGSGIVIPLLAAALPVLRGSFISVRSALDNYGVKAAQTRQGALNFISRLSFISESFKLSVRNVFRLHSRLMMTVGLLATGGAMFMTALNVADAWDDNLKRIYQQRLYDLDVKLNERIKPDTILETLRSMPGVTAAEGWDYSATSVVRETSRQVSHTYPDKAHGSFTLLALPPGSKLLDPTLVEGMWLSGKAKNEIVLNQLARSGVKIGDSVKLAVEGKITAWKVTGFCEDVGSGAAAYVSIDDFSRVNHSIGMVKMLRVAYSDRSRDFAYAKNREIEVLLESKKVSVSSSLPVWLLHNAVAAHMKVLVNSLMAMALLMAVVGTLGLTSTMSMSIMERTREIGVMRAIGGTPGKIRSIVVYEGLLIGMISIVIAFILALILSSWMGEFIGNMAFRTPLSLTISVTAFVLWILIILVGSFAAAYFPARRASRLTTREALAYE
ncbi:ABC transporter permease [Fulvivirgaceae bacterium PWU4]|uniref:ABC transporter permease n=1 Tax=Chryseosolibacter histidini TaxID=2782349 RepID=A0AAP2DFG3_9BACT|nr:ABC transporter permease [Chryseosolibacter histidini]MBT1695360.1 ABC transporter permease [Chryseosolibacter histidini]